MTVKEISEKTALPLSLVGVLVTVVVSLVVWGKSIEAQADKIPHLENTVESTQKLYHSIDKRLARIEGALKIKRDEDARD